VFPRGVVVKEWTEECGAGAGAAAASVGGGVESGAEWRAHVMAAGGGGAGPGGAWAPERARWARMTCTARGSCTDLHGLIDTYPRQPYLGGVRAVITTPYPTVDGLAPTPTDAAAAKKRAAGAKPRRVVRRTTQES
jgi:hypothetical protein